MEKPGQRVNPTIVIWEMGHAFIRSILAIAACICLLSSCNLTKETFRFAYQDEGPNKQIMHTMKGILEKEFNVEIVLLEVERPHENLERLAAKEIDFLLHENYAPYAQGNVSTAFIAYPKFLHIFYRNEDDAEILDFKTLISNRRIYLEHANSVENLILQDLASFYSIEGQYELVSDMTESDVVIHLSSLIMQEALEDLSEFKLFSFDNAAMLGKGSKTEGISLRFHRMRPYIIPEGSYGEFTRTPIVTLEVDMVMLARQDLPVVTVNDLIKTILRNKQSFVSIDPVLFIGLKESFDRSGLSYPLHEGSRAYLDREEPGFLERYAELAGVAFSMLIALIGGGISFSKWRQQRKKDRVDVFYKGLMDIKNTPIKCIDDGRKMIRSIKDEQNKAFEMLINEELAANESFRIYMELNKETMTEVKLKMKALQLAESKS
ncbi:MAG: hypothetical protein O2887_02075 [Bacteroidetes bacterium]|nr:hypothetical protein [Bacteroidota bacterium]MDA1119278.1 hypothetical protein [Bacteroidota bacterium]